jgi:hypothetical protein
MLPDTRDHWCDITASNVYALTKNKSVDTRDSFYEE